MTTKGAAMTMFYLQSDGERSVIHTALIDGFGLRAAPLEARSWIAAKKEFGFDLTALQTEMMKRGEA